MTIYFDMDGTIANLYQVENWLEKLQAEDASPYGMATPMLHMSSFARRLNKLQKLGYELGIISWLSKTSSRSYDEAVTAEKYSWLEKHLPSVHWNSIYIVPYGTNKWEVCKEGILFDDEERNRSAWRNKLAYSPNEINLVLEKLIKG